MTDFSILSFALAVVSTCLCLLGFAMALYAVIEVRAMAKSTHNIQYVPFDNAFEDQDDKDLNKKVEQEMAEEYPDLFEEPFEEEAH